MTVEEYSLDTNRSIEEILKKCKELGINASNKDDFLEDDDIIYLDNELVNNEENLLKSGKFCSYKLGLFGIIVINKGCF